MARIMGAVSFSIIIGLLMQFVFRTEESRCNKGQILFMYAGDERPLWQGIYLFVIPVLILIDATWGPGSSPEAVWIWIQTHITSIFGVGLGIRLIIILKVSWVQVLIATFVVASVSWPSHSPLLGFVSAITA